MKCTTGTNWISLHHHSYCYNVLFIISLLSIVYLVINNNYVRFPFSFFTKKKTNTIFSLNYIIPLMIAAMVSKWTGDRLTNGSIYEEHIRLNDYPYLGSYDELDNTLVAADVMHPRR